MNTPVPARAVLPAEDVAERVAQLTALSDPANLRACSVLATLQAPASSHDIAARAELPVAEVEAAMTALVAVGLVASTPGSVGARYALTGVALIRFGRLLTRHPTTAEGTSPPAVADLPPAVADLPPAIESIASRLAYRFSSTFSPETVRRYVGDSYRMLEQRASIRQHLPSLTSRFTTDRLEALATARGLRLTITPEVLFVCVQNAGRSQMAAALMEDLAGDRVHVRTAGSRPAAAVDPMVLKVLEEIGVPPRVDAPKPLSDEVVQAADVVVTMGCGDACPVYPGRIYLEWPVQDPIGESLETVRQIRDDIQQRVRGLATLVLGS